MNSAIDEKKICFIICSNNPMYAEECVYYIEHLKVPEGYSTEVSVIEDAASMASGYNQGMRASDARYKVYLHHDTFIVNHNFIRDILDIFNQDEQIGMIGMIGSPRLPASGVMWDGARCGAMYTWRIDQTVESRMEEVDGLAEVEVVDGFCMVTRYDVPWREDLFKRWDFYDCSQCKEFARRGYKIVVPEMAIPWCLHDSGYINDLNYEGERIKFLEEYWREIPECMEVQAYNATVILTAHNQRDELQASLRWLEGVGGISNIIVVDNGSVDGTAEWLATQPYEYIWFDEGTQGFGRVWNAVLQNFETQDYIVFLAVGVYPEKGSLINMMRTLSAGHAEIVNPVSNTYPTENSQFAGKEKLSEAVSMLRALPDRLKYKNILYAYWKMWAVRKEIFDKNGYFCEELQAPEDVLTDYMLRMIANGYSQVVCHSACAYDGLASVLERIYPELPQWRISGKHMLRSIWQGMNYFNLWPNRWLVNCIREDRDKAFRVLEVGCDLGATLYEIQSCFPNCRTYGLDINRAAIRIAKHITEAEYGNIEELKIPFEGKFDYIIFGDVLEHLRHPEEVLAMCNNILAENGCIIASVPNIMHLSVMEELVEGRFIYEDTGLLDRTHIHFFTYYEIIDMFRRTGYEAEYVDKTIIPLSDRQKAIGRVLLSLSDNTQDWMYETFQYVVKARKK